MRKNIKNRFEVLLFIFTARYVDLLHMVQPDYANDPIIVLLLKEMEEYASVCRCGED